MDDPASWHPGLALFFVFALAVNAIVRGLIIHSSAMERKNLRVQGSKAKSCEKGTRVEPLQWRYFCHRSLQEFSSIAGDVQGHDNDNC